MNGQAMGETGAEPFGMVCTIEPRSRHTHTAVFLHDRGSTGEEFARELVESLLPEHSALDGRFAGWRWVFPSSRSVWNEAFGETMPA